MTTKDGCVLITSSYVSESPCPFPLCNTGTILTTVFHFRRYCMKIADEVNPSTSLSTITAIVS